MKKGTRSLLGGLLLCAMLLPMPAQATTVLQLSEESMVQLSSLIVRGKVVGKKAIAGPRGMGVVTLVTIEVQEEMVGRTKPKRVVVRHFGGTLNGKNVKMIGGPSFTIGNEVVVFVQASKYLPTGEYLLVGLTQGKWIVHRPKVQASVPSSQVRLVRDLHHVNMVKAQGYSNGTKTANVLTLDVMRNRLKTHYKKLVLLKKQNLLKLPQKVMPKVQLKGAPQKLKAPLAPVQPKKTTPTTPNK